MDSNSCGHNVELLSGRAHGVRTGNAGRTSVQAQPLWCKSLTKTTNIETSEPETESRRYFYSSSYMPGYLAGFNNVLHKQQFQFQLQLANLETVGIFDDIKDPALAGFINILNDKLPTFGRVFHVQRSKLSGD